ncbi:MAG: glycolate oxidase iron-sulfur subunit, partial [Solirubrobacteraceae bacterium]|jgi:glycolate oxidase iron-sulfur subunit|nr:glycolate oxidase iron-sulfur subunit [Solirubrobacteraceae bacterium]
MSTRTDATGGPRSAGEPRHAADAYDALNPPEPSLIDDCVHCGFCLPTCPTYVLWGEEANSPRGRILLMRAGHEEDSPLSTGQVSAWDNCLGCMACVTACPSGVQYDKLIEDTRAQVERRWERPRMERLRRRIIFALFPHPDRMKWLAPFTPLARPTVRFLGRFPRLRNLAQLAPPNPSRVSIPEVTPAQGAARGRVGFLQGCVQRVFFGDVNAATVAVLSAEGFEVWTPERPRCCGALQLHTGVDARERARETIEVFEGCDVVAVNAAGCGSAMKDYGHLFRDDPEWSERAAAFSAKVRDVTEVLAEHEPQAPRHPLEMVVAYHDACHLAHAQGVRAQPRALLATIPGLELREPAEWELCCGSAGVWNLLNPEPAAELGQRKARNLLDTGAQAVAAGNPGCALQIGAYADLPVHHPMQLLLASIQGRNP